MKIIHYKAVDSTQKIALELLKEKLVTEDTLILTNQQLSGRGRSTKTWTSSLGDLTMSLILHRRNIITNIPMPIIVAIAIKKSLLECGVEESLLHYKWPNDILLNYKKISGTLITKEEDSFIIGIGVNIVSHPQIQDKPFSCSLKEEGFDIDKTKLYQTIYQKILEWLDVYHTNKTLLKQEYIQSQCFLNEEILVKDLGISGICLGIDEDFNLLLSINKEIKKISFGEII